MALPKFIITMDGLGAACFFVVILSLNRKLVQLDLRSSLLTLGIAQTCLAILSLNRKLRLL